MNLYLEDGTLIEGRRRGASVKGRGETVFTTAYTGYEETLTDPSYNGQILIFSYPLIGNYGVDERRFESDEIQVNGVIAREMTDEVSEWLEQEGIPAIDHIDTRQLVTDIRDNGSGAAGLGPTGPASRAACLHWQRSKQDMTHWSSKKEIAQNAAQSHTIALLDCGVKRSMIDKLSARATVIRLPWDTSIDEIADHNPDLLFVSNGPGNPEKYEQAIDTVEHFHNQELPIAGICLGQQIITLALGGSTRKMKFGHRGSNQPVIDTRANQVRMTTQNHSYEVSDIPDELQLVQKNVNDDSPEGLRGPRVIARQYHPEANPGPQDSFDFFDDVVDLISASSQDAVR